MKKKILIWGAGEKGGQAYAVLKESRFYEAAAFGDNNPQVLKAGKCGKEVVDVSGMEKMEDLEGIVIASSYSKEIKEQLQSVTDIPIYDSVEKLVYTRISIDISGFCNAKCKWCVTGRNNTGCGINTDRFMEYADFVRIYFHLYDVGIIEKNTEIMLYSWGEPLLNKDYISIVEFLAEQGQRFSVSTNASNVQISKRKGTYEKCSSFLFSMPGFSQASYDRIHGFHFEKIKENIRMLNDNIRENGFEGEGSISFHVYRFNHGELEAARKFSGDLGLRFHPYYPYFNGNSMAEEYLERRMDETNLREAAEELHLSHVEQLLEQRPADYRCFLEDIVSVDWKGNFVLCCAADEALPDYDWGSVYQVESVQQMRKKRSEMLQCGSCKKCRKLGIDYWMGNNPSYQMGNVK